MENADAVRFTLLGGGTPVDEDELYRLYSYPAELTRCVLRGNVIASLDGAATNDGISGGLGGAGDRWLFALQRELADVIVVGAGTARTENYGGARLSVAQRRRRQALSQSEVPPIALVTRTGLIQRDMAVLTGSEVLPLVLTCAASVGIARDRVGVAAEVVDCSGADPHQVDLTVLVDRLAQRGLLRVLTEGGPSLLGGFVAATLLDEMCLTSAPLLLGGNAVRIATGETESLTRLRRVHVLTDEDGYLYARYVRIR
jgi:5-amino-6-(5-phosphoribosylamino)uracil reductase